MTALPSAFGGGGIPIPITISLPPGGVVPSGSAATSVATLVTGERIAAFLLLHLLHLLPLALLLNLSLFTF